MNDLNKKLAGFVWGKENVVLYGDAKSICYRENDKIYLSFVPDFPNDLNSCFKFLEPELYRRGLRYQLNRLQDGHLAEIFKPSKGWSDCVAYAVDENPAMAFCKAVEILMEKS